MSGARVIELSLGRDTRLERRVPLGRAAQRALTAYLQVRPQLADAERETESLWLCGRGVPMSGPRIYQTVRARGQEAGLGNRASPSALRRACALHLLSAGAAPGDVTVLLGFSSSARWQDWQTCRKAGFHLKRRRKARVC
jgi:integrase/recombinase XerC